MPPFTYHRPDSTEAALAALAAPGVRPLGGGTDLFVAMREGVTRTAGVVDLRRLPSADLVTEREDGSLLIGTAVRIAHIAAHPVIRERFAALAEAAQAVGTPALRNMGTLGGNLCQRIRCWYLRRGIACHKSGASGCPAVEGENQYHAILSGGPCHAVHPSDPAVALTALDAIVLVVGRGLTRRRVPMAGFYAGAAANPRGEAALADGEIVEAVELPPESAGGTQRFVKLMQRGSWDFALVSLAAVKRTDGEVRLVLGGIAPQPYRVNPSIEQDVASGALDDVSVDALAERALYDAAPLSGNAYKVKQAAALLKRAMRELSGA